MERRKFFLFAAGSAAALMTGALAEPWSGHDDHDHGSHGTGSHGSGSGSGGSGSGSGGGGSGGSGGHGSGGGGGGGGGSHADHFGGGHGDHFGGGGHDDHFGGGHGDHFGGGGHDDHFGGGVHFGGDHDRYWRPEYGQRRYIDRDRIFFNLRRRHYSRFIGDPYWFQGRYVVRTYDRWGNVIFVEIDPYSGDFIGVVRF